MTGTPKLFDRITPSSSSASSPELFTDPGEDEDLTLTLPMPIDLEKPPIYDNENEENIPPSNPNTLNDQEEEEDQVKKRMLEDFKETQHFYRRLKGYNQYDLTLSNFKYWKGEPYVGRYYREFID